MLNIGAGEGYYAVGLARRNLSAHVFAFETNPEGQMLIRELARLNGVEERVTVYGECCSNDLATALSRAQKVLVVMDIEGAEIELLKPQEIADLSRAHILVEAHNAVCPGANTILRARFNDTHRITNIPATRRTFVDFSIPLSPMMLLMPKVYFELHMGERPAGMSWLYLEPR